ncbi:glycosyltransferase [Leucothrix sargassi]|nr:glycosyltransferase [Leucothrix sargassi]
MVLLNGFCLSPYFFVRPKNTDWMHTKFLYNELNKSKSEVKIELDKRIINASFYNFSYACKVSASRFGLNSFTPYQLYNAPKSGYDFLYAYGKFPKIRGDIPIIWHSGPTDIDVLKSRGMSKKEINLSLAAKKEFSRLANRIGVSSEYSKVKLCEQFDIVPDKVDVLPFILPCTEPVTDELIHKKHTEEVINILFVGRAARRKGLDLLLEAFEKNFSNNPQIQLIVVSEMQDGNVSLPDINNITYIPNAGLEAVQSLMRRSHIFIMPSREESFGIVYIEAMAAGAVPVACNKPQQQHLLLNGEIGKLVESSVADISQTLKALIFDSSTRRDMALKGLKSFRDNYYKKSALAKYEQSFKKTVESENG